MIRSILLSFPLALVWMILSQQLTAQGFVVGYIFGFAVILLVRSNIRTEDKPPRMRLLAVPGQIFALATYTARLTVDVWLSGVDVARRVLQPEIPINPGMIEISTQDETGNSLISALSAHSITITPGELVVDFDDEDEAKMIVHTLDVEASTREKLEADQARRLRLFNRILGNG